jgi:hypothetical protein
MCICEKQRGVCMCASVSPMNENLWQVPSEGSDRLGVLIQEGKEDILTWLMQAKGSVCRNMTTGILVMLVMSLWLRHIIACMTMK